jgi:hypothetical protein
VQQVRISPKINFIRLFKMSKVSSQGLIKG